MGVAYVIRHARAGDRSEWSGDDRLRPLSRSGREQAEAIGKHLEHEPITTILSSGYLRCVQIVEPLAARRRLAVERVTGLEEGAGSDGVLRLIERHRGRTIVCCSHGDVMEELLEVLIARGLVKRARANMEKGAIWALREQNGEVTGASYVPAP